MTGSGIEPQSPGPLANTIPTNIKKDVNERNAISDIILYFKFNGISVFVGFNATAVLLKEQ